MKKGFSLGLLVGIILTVILVFIFKHKLAKWYAGRYGTQFAAAVDVGIEEFVKKYIPGLEIDIRKTNIPLSLN